MSSVELNIGGVPEHFNLPWHLSIENKLFEKNNLTVRWKDYPGGTGAMCADLRSGELDIAIVLTEGIVADIARGNTARIVQWYVTSPLLWGIHVPANSVFQTMEEVKGKRYAISRFGSGSHLMAHVDSSLRGWALNEDQFIVVNNLDGAREALKNNMAEIFFWEQFTTKPLVDNGEFRRIDTRPTPWPCFVIAASGKAIEQKGEAIAAMQEVVAKSCKDLMEKSDAVSMIARRYGLQEKDVRQWMDVTSWAIDNTVEAAELDRVVNALMDLRLIEQKIPVAGLCSSFCNLQ